MGGVERRWILHIEDGILLPDNPTLAVHGQSRAASFHQRVQIVHFENAHQAAMTFPIQSSPDQKLLRYLVF